MSEKANLCLCYFLAFFNPRRASLKFTKSRFCWQLENCGKFYRIVEHNTGRCRNTIFSPFSGEYVSKAAKRHKSHTLQKENGKRIFSPQKDIRYRYRRLGSTSFQLPDTNVVAKDFPLLDDWRGCRVSQLKTRWFSRTPSEVGKEENRALRKSIGHISTWAYTLQLIIEGIMAKYLPMPLRHGSDVNNAISFCFSPASPPPPRI